MKIVIDKGIKLPIKSHLPDVGLDIFMPHDLQILPFQTCTIGLGIHVSIPEGFAGMLVPRSSIADKGLIIQTAIIDPDYTGEIHLIITNCSMESQFIFKDSRVCSLVVYSVLNARLDVVDELEVTERGSNGLGSSGL